MGILFNAVQQDMKRNFIIQQLQDANITEYQNQNILDLDYQTLKYVLSMHKIQNS
ncbi:hypothetical protein [Bacillus sp. FJAT-49736]|uniref:hypothetical protein n=1 Tax=Bacillus sp. FJAT-49736 TaxID=2833582 RepID=UPI001BCA1C4D|nr:hypothetical protein [Bacillus sp. FJAT-49736]MBS4172090.1 hypothetical protein [Bacillus sp. FJAT-49736]